MNAWLSAIRQSQSLNASPRIYGGEKGWFYKKGSWWQCHDEESRMNSKSDLKNPPLKTKPQINRGRPYRIWSQVIQRGWCSMPRAFIDGEEARDPRPNPHWSAVVPLASSGLMCFEKGINRKTLTTIWGVSNQAYSKPLIHQWNAQGQCVCVCVCVCVYCVFSCVCAFCVPMRCMCEFVHVRFCVVCVCIVCVFLHWVCICVCVHCVCSCSCVCYYISDPTTIYSIQGIVPAMVTASWPVN